ncbi:MAG: DUF1540 domain-containing protein [Firmicutes bacterium]|nr:DUF1540 domain-containing protein [Bacillota bacterium]
MKDLKCGKTECCYNKAYECCAKEIEVTDCAGCKTYKEDDRKSNHHLFEAGEDFAKRSFDIDTAVYCKADCIFNKDNICKANGITVLGDLSQEAVCATFMKA